MKRIIVGFLTLSIFLTGCNSDNKPNNTSQNTTVDSESISKEVDDKPDETSQPEKKDDEDLVKYNSGDVLEDYSSEIDPESFYALNDTELMGYMENDIYADLLKELDGTDYFVENVETKYISKEYIEELEYNSKENVFFGYTLSELNNQFRGKRYMFTLGDDGQTAVQEFEEFSDDTYQRALKNVAIGSGVILICITVSSVTATAAPAVSVILAASAKTGATMAVSGGSIAAVTSAIITGVKTGDMDAVMRAAVDAGSNAFKWGAISGAITGGASEGFKLFGATLNGLTMNQAAMIQRETGWPLEVIKSIHSYEEYNVYLKAGVVPAQIDGKWAFIQGVDWNFKDEDGFTNLQRVLERGYAPIGPDGKSFELHHIGQRADSPLAILTHSQHHAPGDYGFIHYAEEGKDITDAAWASQKQEFWEKMAEMYLEGKGL